MKKLLSKITDSFKGIRNLRVLTATAMLTALFVVSSFFLDIYMPWNHAARVSLGFVSLALAGKLCGPVPAMMVGLAGDVLQYLISPKGAYFPGITLCIVLTGLVFGLFFYREKTTLPRCIAAAVVDVGVIELILKSYVLQFLNGTSFFATFLTRLPVNGGITLVLMIGINFALLKAADRIFAQSKRFP